MCKDIDTPLLKVEGRRKKEEGRIEGGRLKAEGGMISDFGIRNSITNSELRGYKF
jgi:hypothetical protein